MATHGGYIFGYQSMATVYPELKLGIFQCINGQRTGDGLGQINDYIADVLTAAAPASLSPSGTTRRRRTDQISPQSRQTIDRFPQHPSNAVHSQKIQKIPAAAERSATSAGLQRRRALDEYVGTYGNFAFGNVTVVLDSGTGRLRGLYGDLGVVDMVNLNGDDTFTATFEDPLFFFPPVELQFRRDGTNVVDSVAIPILLPQFPPVFVRGRIMAEAPPPPTGDC